MTLARGLLWLASACAACLWLAGRARGTVNCRTACTKCAARSDHQALLEVYCAMCHECRERRRAWRHFAPRRSNKPAPATSPRPAQRANDHDEFPDESPDGPPDDHPEQPRCPEPPPCDSDLLEGGRNEFIPTTPERARPPRAPQLTPSLTVPAQPCHEHAGCHPAAGVPCCLPALCPYAQPCAQELAPQKMTLAESTTSAPAPTEYFYIHVGVPKDILNNM